MLRISLWMCLPVPWLNANNMNSVGQNFNYSWEQGLRRALGEDAGLHAFTCQRDASWQKLPGQVLCNEMLQAAAPFCNSSPDIQLYTKVSAICVKLLVFREANSTAWNLHILKQMGKAGRQDGFAGRKKESDINQEAWVKHTLTLLNTATQAKEVKYALNGQFILLGKNSVFWMSQNSEQK